MREGTHSTPPTAAADLGCVRQREARGRSQIEAPEVVGAEGGCKSLSWSVCRQHTSEELHNLRRKMESKVEEQEQMLAAIELNLDRLQVLFLRGGFHRV